MNELTANIKQIFEDDINPSLAMHGGSAEVSQVDKKDDIVTVTIKFQGSCVGCGSATSEDGTLLGIQEYLRESLDLLDLVVENIGE
jgi:Fe-S cluster biogenesis protein NfuA